MLGNLHHSSRVPWRFVRIWNPTRGHENSFPVRFRGTCMLGCKLCIRLKFGHPFLILSCLFPYTFRTPTAVSLGNLTWKPPPSLPGNTRRGGCRSVSPCSIHTRRSSGPSSSPYYPHLLRSLKMTPPKMAPKHGNPHQLERRERTHANTHTHTHTHAHTYTHTHTP